MRVINYGKIKKIELIFGNIYLYICIYMNANITSKIYSYLDLVLLSKIIDINKVDAECNKLIIKNISNYYSLTDSTFKSKLLNLNHRCGNCQKILDGDYIYKLSFEDCKFCNLNKNFGIELCCECSNLQMKRGDLFTSFCIEGNHKILYLGINILS